MSINLNKDRNKIEKIFKTNKTNGNRGKLADYIPELAKADINDLALSLIDKNRNTLNLGDYRKKFTLQSVSKILALTLAIEDNGLDRVMEEVGFNPTREKFNSIYGLDLLNTKPSNPMINAGAILTTSLIKGNRVERILSLLDKILDKKLSYSEEVYRSERETGYRNYSIAYLLKSNGLIDNLEKTMEDYFKQCSIEINTKDLAKLAYFYTNKSTTFKGERLNLSKDTIIAVNSILLTSGMYNNSGKFALNVGIPSKSGVSGCIISILPGELSLGLYSPGLDQYGNSLISSNILKDLSKEFNLNIFY